MKKYIRLLGVVILLVILLTGTGFAQNTNARAGWGDTVTHAPDTVLAPIGYLFWDLIVVADDSTLEVSFTGSFPALDKFPLKINESCTWENLPAKTIPRAYIRKSSSFTGSADYRVIRGGK